MVAWEVALRQRASQLQRIEAAVKTASFPSLRVDPALRRAAEDVLQDGETLSSFVELSVRTQIRQRQEQDAFIARGLASRDKARKSDACVSSAAVVKGLKVRLAKARKRPA